MRLPRHDASHAESTANRLAGSILAARLPRCRSRIGGSTSIETAIGVLDPDIAAATLAAPSITCGPCR